MKTLVTLLFFIPLFWQSASAQVCPIVVNSNTKHLLNDTTIDIDNSTIMGSFMPCKTLKIDSAVTVIDTIYLRTGTTFIADSLSTMFGGFIIYAQEGSTVDMNFKNWVLLYYTPTTILIDTPSTAFSKVLCNSIVFDYSVMTESHNCNVATSINEVEANATLKIYNSSDRWILDAEKEFIAGASLQLFTLQGQLIRTIHQPDKHEEIPFGTLSTGIYVLRMRNGSDTRSYKLMVQ